MDTMKRLEKLYDELKLVDNNALAQKIGINRQYLSNIRYAIGSGAFKQLLEFLDADSPLDRHDK